ncbi:MAG TPA: Ig-like domain-containing protein, partial [Geobacteraceae bacterium]|nr:Ig-like domain-containing protein [Geobacteraceae bacterium]
MKKIYAMLLATVILLASCGGGGGGGGGGKSLSSIAVTPANNRLAVGKTQQFTATGTYSDGSTQDLTSSVTWSSSATSVATIASAGMATAVAGGSTTIRAAMGSTSGSTTLTVPGAQGSTLVSITISHPNPKVAQGTYEQFTATGNYSDGSTQDLTSSVTWHSSDTSVAAFNSSPGRATTTISTGTIFVYATYGGMAGAANLTVTGDSFSVIQLVPGDPSTISLGMTLQFKAYGKFTSDGTLQDLTASPVTWSSSNNTIVTIDSNGKATTGPSAVAGNNVNI